MSDNILYNKSAPSHLPRNMTVWEEQEESRQGEKKEMQRTCHLSGVSNTGLPPSKVRKGLCHMHQDPQPPVNLQEVERPSSLTLASEKQAITIQALPPAWVYTKEYGQNKQATYLWNLRRQANACSFFSNVTKALCFVVDIFNCCEFKEKSSSKNNVAGITSWKYLLNRPTQITFTTNITCMSSDSFAIFLN